MQVKREQGNKYRITLVEDELEIPFLLGMDDISDVLTHEKGRKPDIYKKVNGYLALAGITMEEFKNTVQVIVKEDMKPVEKKKPEASNYYPRDEVISLLGTDVIYRKIMAVVASNLFANTESIFMILLGPPGCGKSTACDLFKGSPWVLTTDSMTMNAMAAGTANQDQVSYSLLDSAAGKTLIMHDLTAIFSDDPYKIRNIKGILESVYGTDGFHKFSPGAGNRHYGGHMNLVFGVNTKVFYDTYPNDKERQIGPDLVKTERYIFCSFPQRDHFGDYASGHVITREKKDDLVKKTAAFLEYLRHHGNREIEVDRVLIANKMREYFSNSTAATMATRRMKQCEQFCKALALIDGETRVTESHVDEFVKCLDRPVYGTYGLMNES